MRFRGGGDPPAVAAVPVPGARLCTVSVAAKQKDRAFVVDGSAVRVHKDGGPRLPEVAEEFLGPTVADAPPLGTFGTARFLLQRPVLEILGVVLAL